MLMPSAANDPEGNTEHLRDQGSSVRVPFVHGCLLMTRARTRGGLVCNLSLQGAYVTLDEPLPDRGDRVHLLVQLPGESPLLEADTIVTWQNREPSSGTDSLPAGVGLRFVSLSPGYKKLVDELVSAHQNPDGKNELVLPNLPHAGPRRMPYIQRCTFTGKRGVTETLLCNISRLGAYVTIDPLPAIGEEVSLSFVAPMDGAKLALAGVVTWLNPPQRQAADPLAPGCGIRFVALTTEDERRLKALLEV
jgi:Tfp pilus assembly protein PilZ